MKVDAYRFGQIQVDGRPYDKDLLILPPKILCPWWREEGHRLALSDLDAVLAYAPAVLVVGTGAYGVMRVPDQTRLELEARSITVEISSTEQACQRFNALLEQRCNVAAALHLTC